MKWIIDQLKVFRKDPISLAKKLTNPKLGTYRYKVGDYRVVFDDFDKEILHNHYVQLEGEPKKSKK